MTDWPGLRRLAGRAAIVCLLLAAFWWLLLAVGLTLPVASLQQPVEAAAARVLGQQVEVTGGVRIRPALGPTLVMQGLQVNLGGSPGGGGRLRARRVEARLGLLSLLQGKPRIVALSARGVSLDLDAGTEGLRAGLRSLQPDAAGQPWLQERHYLESLVLSDLQLSWRSAASGQLLRVKLDEIRVSAQPDRPLGLKVRGNLRRQPFVARIDADPVDKLLAPDGAWQVRGALKYAGADLRLNGRVDVPLHGPSLALEFDLHAGRLPLVEAARLQGHLALGEAGAVLTTVKGTVGRTQLAGSGSLDFSAEQPQLRLEVTVPELEASGLHAAAFRELLGAFSAMTSAASASPWRESMAVDAAVLVGSVVHAGVSVQDASVAVHVQDGELTFPLGINLAGVVLQGGLLPEAQGGMPGARIVLRADQADAARLAAGLLDINGIRGHTGEIEVHASAAAAPGGAGVALAAELRVDDADFSYGNLPGQQPVAVAVDRLRLHVPEAGAITASLQGRLLGVPLELALTGGPLQALQQGREWPVTLTATGAGARLAVHGELVAARDSPDARFNADLSGKRLGSLAPWLGVSPCAAADYSMRGQFIFSRNAGRLQFVQARLGDTRMNADLDWTRDEEVPVIHAVVQFDKVVPGDLKGALQFVRLDSPAAATGSLALEMPVLPAIVPVRNADIRLNIAHIDLGLVDISNLTLTSAIRDAGLQPSPFAVDIGNTGYEGYLERSQGQAGLVWTVAESDPAAGGLLNQLFSNALQWAGSTGRIPLRGLFGDMLDGGAAGDCTLDGDPETGP